MKIIHGSIVMLTSGFLSGGLTELPRLLNVLDTRETLVFWDAYIVRTMTQCVVYDVSILTTCNVLQHTLWHGHTSSVKMLTGTR